MTARLRPVMSRAPRQPVLTRLGWSRSALAPALTHPVMSRRKDMKPLRYTTRFCEAAYMRERTRQNRAVAGRIPAQKWMAQKLEGTGLKWSQQCQWGFRIFDFWCAEKGIALEIDGPTHNKDYDNYRDSYNYHRSAIVVLRIPNFNEQTADAAILQCQNAMTWKARRQLLGVTTAKRKLRKSWQAAQSLDELRQPLVI